MQTPTNYPFFYNFMENSYGFLVNIMLDIQVDLRVEQKILLDEITVSTLETNVNLNSFHVAWSHQSLNSVFASFFIFLQN